MSSMRRWFSVVGWIALACGGGAPAPTSVQHEGPVVSEERQKSPEATLAEAREALLTSDYATARTGFESLLAEECCRKAARHGLAELHFLAGRYREVIAALAKSGDPESIVLSARAHLAMGEVDRAEALLRPLLEDQAAYEARVVLGDVLIETGRRQEAEPLLMEVIEAYNEGRITEEDGANLVWLARAAHWLRSPEDANDAFNMAEQALGMDIPTLLFRAELYLDKYDPGHAEEVLSEVLEKAPNHPDALVLMAQVRLDQALDFEEAKRLVTAAEQVNPHHTQAAFVRAGIALRDMLLEEALRYVARGLETNPRDLDLLSMRAAAQFLADDDSAYQATRAEVFRLNGEFSRFYQIVGEYAEWEHRYTEIVEMMQEAIAVDPEDAKALAQLGLNLIRNGEESRGVVALQRAYAKDPFNVRVYNTLNLYEKTIPEHYESVRAGEFTVRYPKEEAKVLSRYVPELLKAAWNKMTKSYDFVPSQPVGIELYTERTHFAVRTSGLPRTAIQGVCFGKTLASMSPRTEEFNLGMTLWHELAHVFHIQLSKNHVPRWFTEGLAEYETLIERPEWKRERDVELFLALREQRLPKIGAMNEAFTHAEDLLDVTVAYYASTQIVRMLAEKFGEGKLREMLVLWGEGHPTEEVVRRALGVSSAELDAQFEAFLEERLVRFRQQFVPLQRVGDARLLQRRIESNPKDADAYVRLGLQALRDGNPDAAKELVGEALKAEEKNPDALWLQGRIELERGAPEQTRRFVKQLLAAGRDGYEVQLMLAKATDQGAKRDDVRRALEKAHHFDPEQSDALYGLLHLAERDKDQASEFRWLQKLARLEEHYGGIYRRLMKLLSDTGAHQEAIEVGQAAVFADMEGVATHVAFAQVLSKAKQVARAQFEFESAVLCPASPQERAAAYLEWARDLKRLGRTRAAETKLEEAQKLDFELDGMKVENL